MSCTWNRTSGRWLCGPPVAIGAHGTRSSSGLPRWSSRWRAGCGLNAADAADVSQTTWLRFVQHLDRIEQPERVGGWLATTARREALRVLRMSGRQIPTDFDEFAKFGDVPAVAPEAKLLYAERDVALSAIFAELPPRCQCILRSLDRDGKMTYEDLGKLLDMPIGSIGPTRARCLERLRRLAVSAGLSISDSAA